jgi:chemotaxis protein CheD
MRYGNYAMEILINEVMKGGCPKEELEIKLFGGATLKSGTQVGSEDNGSIGSRNAEFVLEYLKKEGLKVAATDLGGVTPRRIHFYPSLGKVKRLLLRRQGERSIFSDEGKYKSKIGKPKEGSVELFDD